MGWQARIGDEVSIASHRLGGGRKTGVIREVNGTPGHEYYLVQWDDRHTSILHPGPDAMLVPKGKRRPPKAGKAKAVDVSLGTQAEAPQPAEVAPAPVKRPRRTPVVAGDRLVIKGHHLGERDRDAEILEVLGDSGARRFRVRWSDTGREGLLFPGTDAVIEHFPRRRRKTSSTR